MVFNENLISVGTDADVQAREKEGVASSGSGITQAWASPIS